MVALYLTIASVTAVYCLLCHWLAFGKLYWLWRASAVCTALALLVPVRAYEPLVFFGITSLLFLATASCGRLFVWWREGRRKEPGANPDELAANRAGYQFRLHDLLGLMAIIGAASWMVRIILREQVWLPWVAMLFLAIVCVAMTILMARLVVGPKRLFPTFLLIVFVLGASAIFRFFTSPGPTYPRSILLAYLVGYVPNGQLPVGQLLVLLAFFLAVGFWTLRWLQRMDVDSVSIKVRKGIAGAVALGWASATVWLYVQMFAFPMPPQPSPTGENTFSAVLRRCEGIESRSPRQADAASAEVAELIRKPCFVVIPWDAGLIERKTYETNLPMQLYDLRSVSRNLDAHAKTIGITNPDLAADIITDIFRLGDILGHDGLLGHSAFGMNIEQIGHWNLVPMRSKLSALKARELLDELQRIEQQRETPDVALGRQGLWMHLNDRWEFRLYEICVAPAFDFSSQTDPDSLLYRVTRERTCCCSRLLITDLAIRIYRAEHGKYPDKLDELVPKYLKEVPNDLYTDQPPIYRLRDEGFVLYSVGSDRRDDGGKFSGVMNFPRGGYYDWNVESLTQK